VRGGDVEAVAEEGADEFAVGIGVEAAVGRWLLVSVRSLEADVLVSSRKGSYRDSGGGLDGSGRKMVSGFVMARTIFSRLERLLCGMPELGFSGLVLS
jgi:hypothetical protein